MAQAAVRGDRTTAQLVSEFGIHTSQVTAWKKQLLEGVTELFADGRSKRSGEDSSANKEELYEQIGRLKMEVEWLKKSRHSWAEPAGDPPAGVPAMRHVCQSPALEDLRRWSIVRPCELLGLPPSTCDDEPVGEPDDPLSAAGAEGAARGPGPLPRRNTTPTPPQGENGYETPTTARGAFFDGMSVVSVANGGGSNSSSSFSRSPRTSSE